MESYLSAFGLNSRNFLVTGAASGIGKATSILLSKLGASLILVDVDSEGLYQTKIQCTSSAVTLAIDLSKTELIKNSIVETVGGFGKLHGFVHCAGIPYICPLKGITERKYMEVFRINTVAGLELAKLFADRKISQEEHRSIVFISSVYAIVGSAANVGYAMSKAALHGITKSLAIELAPKKIRVNCIAPGFVKTQMMLESDKSFSEDRNEVLESLHPLGLGEPADIANACAFLLSEASKWITGTIMNVDGGFTAK